MRRVCVCVCVPQAPAATGCRASAGQGLSVVGSDSDRQQRLSVHPLKIRSKVAATVARDAVPVGRGLSICRSDAGMSFTGGSHQEVGAPIGGNLAV